MVASNADNHESQPVKLTLLGFFAASKQSKVQGAFSSLEIKGKCFVFILYGNTKTVTTTQPGSLTAILPSFGSPVTAAVVGSKRWI